MPRLAANLSMMFTELPFERRFDAAARAGFRGVECLFPYDWPLPRLAGLLREAGLEQALFNGPPGDWAGGERGLASLPGREAEFRDGLRRALDYAQGLGCSRLHVMAGRHGDPATYVANLRWAAEQAAPAGVRILIEPINDRDMPGYFLTTTAQARAVMAEVAHGNLWLQYDLYHAQIMEGDLTRTIDENLPRIGHIQVSSVPGRHEPDGGEVNLPFLFDHIDKAGYDGWVGCEYRPRSGTLEGLGWARPWLK